MSLMRQLNVCFLSYICQKYCEGVVNKNYLKSGMALGSYFSFNLNMQKQSDVVYMV